MKARAVSFFTDKHSKTISLKCFYCTLTHKPISGSTENQHKNAPSMPHSNKMKYFVHTCDVYLQLYKVSWTYID